MLFRSGVEPAAIDQAIFGNIATPSDAANIARIIALRAGVPKERPAHSVSRNCASGIESVVEAARLIDSLALRPLLDGKRGRPPADLSLLAAALAAFSVMVADLADAISEIDANPVLATADGPLALDALVVARK